MLSVLAACSNSTPSSESQQSSKQATADSADTAQPDTEAKTDSRVVENITLQPGSDPMAIVFATRQPAEQPVGSEQFKLSYPTPDKAVVVVTRTGLQDDSVAAIRTRYEFVPVDSATGGAKQWQLTQVTEQNKCQANRGSKDWTGELCK
jgi:hypothetical protein